MTVPVSPGDPHQGAQPASRTLERSHARRPELGKLVGSWSTRRSQHIRSLVMDVVDAAGSQQVELPMVPFRLDAESHALRMVEPGVPLRLVPARSWPRSTKTTSGFQSSIARPDTAPVGTKTTGPPLISPVRNRSLPCGGAPRARCVFLSSTLSSSLVSMV